MSEMKNKKWEMEDEDGTVEINWRPRRRTFAHWLQCLVRYICFMSVVFIGVSLLLVVGMELKDQMNGEPNSSWITICFSLCLGVIVTATPFKYFK